MTTGSRGKRGRFFEIAPDADWRPERCPTNDRVVSRIVPPGTKTNQGLLGDFVPHSTCIVLGATPSAQRVASAIDARGCHSQAVGEGLLAVTIIHTIGSGAPRSECPLWILNVTARAPAAGIT